MKKILSILLVALTAVAAHATHFPPATANAVKRLAHDGTNMYILHYNGLEVLDKATGLSACYDQASGHFSDPRLNAIALQGSTVWVGGQWGDLTAITGSRAECRRLSYADDGTEGMIRMLGINAIVFDGDGRMYVGGDNCVGVVSADGSADISTFPGSYYGTEVWQMAADADNTVWISATAAISGNGLMAYSANGGGVDMSVTAGDVPFLASTVKALAVDPSGRKWFGSMDKGTMQPMLYCFDGKTYRGYGLDKGMGIPADMVFDGKGRLWFLPTMEFSTADLGYGEYSKGPLCCLEDGLLTAYPFGELSMGYAYCVDADGDNIYVGTDCGVLAFSNGRFTRMESSWEGHTTGIIRHGSATAIPTATYDLQGRRLSARPEKGMYIEGGRKRVVR